MLYSLTDECCYWYKQFPATLSACDRDVNATSFHLRCEVHYRPSKNFTSVKVKWYKSTIEETAGIEGESIVIGDGKYHIVNSAYDLDVFIQQNFQ